MNMQSIIILLTDSQGSSIYSRFLMLLIPYLNALILKGGPEHSPGPSIYVRLRCYKNSLNLESSLQDKHIKCFAVTHSKSFNLPPWLFVDKSGFFYSAHLGLTGSKTEAQTWILGISLHSPTYTETQFSSVKG